MTRAVAIVVLVLAGGCPADEPADTGGSDQAGETPAPAAAPRDAGVAREQPAVAKTVDAAPAPHAEYDLSQFHLDDTAGARDDYRPPARRPAPREAKPIHITLRSTPPGAIAAVDGEVVGRTPAFWEGEVTGTAREFTFVLPGYAMARYRFVPVTSGVVHGRLEALAAPKADAGPGEVTP